MVWVDANWGYLHGEIGRVRAAVAQARSGDRSSPPPTPIPAELIDSAPAITRLCRLFGLSTFERDVVVLCAGVEIDPDVAKQCQAALEATGAHRPTPALVLAALGGGHVAAFAPTAALRRHQLIDLADGPPLFAAPLAIDPRILHFLIGVDQLDERLAALFQRVDTSEDLVTRSRAGELARAAALLATGDGVVVVSDSSADERRAVAAAIGAGRNARMYRVRAHELPSDPSVRHALAVRWVRERRLLDAGLIVEIDTDGPPDLLRNAVSFIDQVDGLVIVCAREPVPLERASHVAVELRAQPSATRLDHWRDVLGPRAADVDTLDRIASQFVLAPAAMRRAAHVAQRADGPIASHLWNACRQESRHRLDDLARRIEPIATWQDLVLPDEQLQELRAISNHLKHRFQVYDRWGFGSRTGRGLGSGAMFAGASGTGKTLAAEVLAREAELDLYHVDLSQIVNKYVGETEKNLRRVFDAAEVGGALLLFDEADALFGKRGEVDRGTDRYANLEVSYLLQRMETYRGLAILTTNQREALDSAFLRRLRFVVSFPFPDVDQRIGLWLRAFPSTAPVGEIDVRKLARLKLPGGHIRNIAVNAAFVAAEAGEVISMVHLLHAARAEFAKIERPFPEADIAGWLS